MESVVSYEMAEQIAAMMSREMVWLRVRLLLEPPPATTEVQCPCCEGEGHLGEVLRRCPVCRGWRQVTAHTRAWVEDMIAHSLGRGARRADSNELRDTQRCNYRIQRWQRVTGTRSARLECEERFGRMGELLSAQGRIGG